MGINIECVHKYINHINKDIDESDESDENEETESYKNKLSLIFKHIEPTIETFELLFKYHTDNKKLICAMMEKHKFDPNINCLNNLMLCCDKSIVDIKWLLDCKIIPNDTTIDNLVSNNVCCDENEEIVELLLSYGYKITYESLEKLFNDDIFIDNLERFGIPYDEKLYYLCYKSSLDLLNKYNFDINPTLLSLRKMILGRKVDQYKVIKYMEDNDIKPDRYCADNVLNKSVLLDYFLNKNYIPSQILFINSMRGKKGLFDKIMKNSNFDYKIMGAQYT